MGLAAELAKIQKSLSQLRLNVGRASREYQLSPVGFQVVTSWFLSTGQHSLGTPGCCASEFGGLLKFRAQLEQLSRSLA